MKLTEEEIRPQKIFDEYLELARIDTINYFAEAKREEVNCFLCDVEGEPWGNKSSFEYKICPSCLSIFVSPRPELNAFNVYYTDSPSTKYWASTFYKVTEKARREKLWKPKAQMIKERILKLQGSNPVKTIVDIGGGYGVFDEEIQKIMDVDILIIEPSIHLSEICQKKGFTVIEKFMEELEEGELPKERKCFVSFELFEHLHDPIVFIQSLYKNMKPGDLLIFTTLSGMGIDIQLLKEKSKAISPPHHLNFFNPKSISTLLEKNGLNVIESITPGKLDMDILKSNIEHVEDPFWKNIFKYSSEEEIETMQDFISTSGLSSHMMIICEKL